MRIAVIAHDNKKADLVSFVLNNSSFFKNVELVATGTTGSLIEKAGFQNVFKKKSGPLGGDAQIASEVVEGKIDGVIFFIDPLSSHPHDVDIHMLQRQCVIHDVPLALNYSTAELMISKRILNKTES